MGSSRSQAAIQTIARLCGILGNGMQSAKEKSKSIVRILPDTQQHVSHLVYASFQERTFETLELDIALMRQDLLKVVGALLDEYLLELSDEIERLGTLYIDRFLEKKKENFGITEEDSIRRIQFLAMMQFRYTIIRKKITKVLELQDAKEEER